MYINIIYTKICKIKPQRHYMTADDSKCHLKKCHMTPKCIKIP